MVETQWRTLPSPAFGHQPLFSLAALHEAQFLVSRPQRRFSELLAMKAHGFKILVSVCHGQKFRLKKTKCLICIFLSKLLLFVLSFQFCLSFCLSLF